MMFPYSKGLVPQLWNISNGISQWCEAKRELNFLEDSDSDNRRFSSEPDVVEYNKTLIAKGSSWNLRSNTTRIVSRYMTLFLSPSSQWTFKAKMRTINFTTLPVITSTICKNASTLHMQKLNDSLAKEPRSTQGATKCATWMLDTKDNRSRSPVNCQRKMQASKCQSSKNLLQLLIHKPHFDGTLGGWKT